MLEIRLLGPPEFRRGGRVLPPLATRKTQSLLAYLILHRDRPHSRDELATLFWGDRGEARARGSLSTGLWRIRRLLMDDCLLAESASVQFNPASPFWLDVAEFEKHLSASKPPNPERATNDLRQAVDLYRGDLLEGFYDDWCIEERYRLEALYLDALSRLVACSEVQGDAASVIAYAQKYLAHDPLQENIHLAAMRALVALGDAAGARRQWQFCCEARQQELRAPPSPQLLKQAETILGAQFALPLPVHCTLTWKPPRHEGIEQPPFVGRVQELNALLAQWEKVTQGRGGSVFTSGEAGVGKTRLTEEFAAAVRWRGGTVARGRCYEPERSWPYQPLADVLRDLSAQDDWRDSPAIPAWVRTELASLIPELTLGSTGVWEQRSPPTFLLPDAEARQAVLFRAIVNVICHCASRTPLLIVLEDLHWAADSTLAGIHYLARQIHNTRVLIVGTFRSEEVDEEHRLRAIMAQLAREGLAQHLALERLSADAVTELIQRARGSEVSPEWVSRLYAHTEGNALFLIETLRALDESPARAGILPVPNTVRALIQTRLGRLSASARELVGYAAVAGRAFDFDLVCRAADTSEETGLEAVDELLRRGFLREGTGVAGRDYEFEHSLIHQVVYVSLHHRRRCRLHRLIGETMESLYRERREELFGLLAHRFDRAGVGGKALDYAEQAARRAWTMGAASETERYYDIALRWLEQLGAAAFGEGAYRERRFDLLLGREQALDVLARRAEQAAAQQALADLAEVLNDDMRRAQVHLRRFWFHYPQHLADARDEAERALVLSQRQGTHAVQVQSVYALALACAGLGDPARGLEYAETALAQARALGDRLLEGWSLLQLGYIYKQLGDLDRAQATLEQSLVINRALRNQFAVGRTIVHLGDVYRARGWIDRANQHYREGLALAQEIGYRWVEEDIRARLANNSS